MSFLDEYFSVQVFFIVLRETIELAIIVSVLLAFVNKSLEPVTHEQKNSSRFGQAASVVFWRVLLWVP